MGHQIYFLQSEEDAVQFFDYLETLGVVIWTGKDLKSPEEIKGDVYAYVSLPFSRFILVPQEALAFVQSSGDLKCTAFPGIEFLLCCKKNPASRTYEVGRLYCTANCNSSYYLQLFELYRLLRAFIKRNYSYSSKQQIYFAPVFKQKYEAHYFFATQLGMPITNKP